MNTPCALRGRNAPLIYVELRRSGCGTFSILCFVCTNHYKNMTRRVDLARQVSCRLPCPSIIMLSVHLRLYFPHAAICVDRCSSPCCLLCKSVRPIDCSCIRVRIFRIVVPMQCVLADGAFLLLLRVPVCSMVSLSCCFSYQLRCLRIVCSRSPVLGSWRGNCVKLLAILHVYCQENT